ncbi:MAG: SGNH/GDSL hydrolase family protein [Melioribacteraceae bacterium]|nr:SGNH/GDSL hydrolase family protein [Melioribacteraceae bacterium]
MDIETKLSKIFIFIGILEIISSILIFPNVAIFWRTNIVNYYSAMLDYSQYAFFIGLLTMALGFLQINSKKNIVTNLSILYLTVSLFFLGDRLLLAKYGYGLWKHDRELHFVHRPNSTYTWGSEYDNKLIKINSDGYHDDDFNEIKKVEEIRIFILGNSITMGHGVNKDETFSTQLEQFYDSCFVNVFNLGVQGYSTMQELEVLKRNIKFEPDIIFIGFCLNDITEPTYVNKNSGGTGYDYHQIYQISNSILGYLINETGFGKLLYRMKYSEELKNSKLNELKYVQALSKDPYFEKKIEESWKQNLESIKKINVVTDSLSSDFFVLIFPYTFQLFNDDLKKPQNILKSFLSHESISYLDFTDIFKNIIQKEIDSGANLNQSISKYYLDEDHYTVTGHRVIAKHIKQFLDSQKDVNVCNDGN